MSVAIRRLEPTDAVSVGLFFDEMRKAALDRVFHPHPFTVEAAQDICNYGGKDWYAGCFLTSCENNKAQRKSLMMIGYVMLRGWDAGYAVPSFGICVLPKYQGMGIGHALLDVAIVVARLNGSPAVRLKVYPDNKVALSLYRNVGFRFAAELEHGQLVGHLSLR